MSYDQYRPTGFKLLPPVVKNILIISGLFYLATLGIGSAFNIDLTDILGMHYFAAEKFKPYQIVSYMFMHGSFTHILFNMFAFWMFGYVLENVWGSKRFLIYFLITGFGAAMIQMLVFYFETAPVLDAINLYKLHPTAESFKTLFESHLQPVPYDLQGLVQSFQNKYNGLLSQSDSLVNFAHASVSKAKIIATQLDSFPLIADSLKTQVEILNSNAAAAIHQSDSLQAVNIHSTVDFVDQYRIGFLNSPVVIGASGAVYGILLAFGMMFPNTRIYLYFFIPIKAKWFVIIFGAIELIAGFSNVSGDNVAHFAHLGGMLFGFVLIKIWNKRNRKTLF
jgi:membrane associated rhomboid family serine protease